jgi:uncharacterized protein YqfA (UPF0365 family)
MDILMLAQQQGPELKTILWIAIPIVVLIVFLILAALVAQVIGLWFQAFMSNANVSMYDLIGMRFRKVDSRTTWPAAAFRTWCRP